MSLDDVREPVYGVLENVGGPLLARSLALVERGGSVQSIGTASREPTTIDFETERRRAGARRVEVFVMGPGLAADLAYLVSLLEQGALDPQIGWRGSWDRVTDAAGALLERRVRGKAVLDVAGGAA